MISSLKKKSLQIKGILGTWRQEKKNKAIQSFKPVHLYQASSRC